MAASTDGIYRFLSQEMFFLKGAKQRHSGFLPLLMGLFLLGLVFPAMADNTIQGDVRLPGADVAPAGGVVVTIWASDMNSSNAVSKSVLIPEGNAFQAYSISVPSDAAAQWEVSYDAGIKAEDDYVRTGYYASAGTTWDKSAASLLVGGSDHANIDLTLLSGDVISGRISLPAGDVAPSGGLWVSFFVSDNTVNTYHGRAQIPEGASSVAYRKVVPSLAAANWLVKYYGCTGAGCASYHGAGYYSAAGTTWDYDQRTLLPGGSDYSDIDLTLLPGIHISGTLFLPAGDVAPTGGLRAVVEVAGVSLVTNTHFLKRVYIPQGGSSVPYDVSVPSDAAAAWFAFYYCNSMDCPSYIGKAYYVEGGMTLEEAAATPLPSGSNHSGIDMQMVLDIPDGCGQDNEIIAGPLIYSGDYFCSADASITAGQNSVVVGNNAYVVYAAPSISLVPGFAIADHGIFRAGKNLLP